MGTFKKIILTFLLIVCLAALGFTIFLRVNADPKLPEPEPSETVTPAPTPTPEPTPTPTPEPSEYVISFVGDCTLSSDVNGGTFASVVGDDCAYPFAKTVEYFKDDSLSIANLECVFSDQSLTSDSLFSFKAPLKYADILTKGGIDFVSTANNHTFDFGQAGLDDTFAALDKVKVGHGKDGEAKLVETADGLKLGIYCGSYYAYGDYVTAKIGELKSAGAEFIICLLHWGNEGEYRPTDNQKYLGHLCIDAGADVVYGSHPHVLQPVEEYGDGLIFYSLGNWSFGGNRAPRDMDTAIIQVSLKRGDDGVKLEGYELIPCCMSSEADYNNYQPMPYEKDSDAYKRAMSKLDGSFTGANLVVDYSSLSYSSAG